MKKFIVSFILLLLVCSYVNAQQKVLIKKSNNTTESFNFSEIDSIEVKKSSTQVPIITSIQPDKAKEGDTIRIIGKGFGILRTSFVSISGANVDDIFWSDTLIKIVIPKGTKSGKVYVYLDDEIKSNGYDITIDVGVNAEMLLTNLTGRIVDKAGNPIKGIKVMAHDSTTTTDADGLFLIENIKVPKDRCFIVCQHQNYYDASKAQMPGDSGLTVINLTMFTKDSPTLISSASGGTAYLNNGSSIVFPANCFVLEDGSPFTGNAKIASRFVNPTDSTFNDVFPGDLKAKRKDGSITYLYSYGVFPVDMITESGQRLELKPGTKADISFAAHNEIPSSVDTIESWYYDYKEGMWIEDDAFIKENNSFIAKASHFSNYNCDRPMPPVKPAKITGKVVNCTNDNIPAPGIKVFIGQTQVTTDNFGRFSVSVPPNLTYNIRIDVKQKDNSRDVSVKEGDSVFIYLSLKNPIIKGKVIDCDKKPIARMIVAKWANNGFASTYSYNGNFSISVPDNVDITLTAGNKNMSVSKLDTCEFKNVGIWEICDSTAPSKLIDLVKIPAGSFRMGSIYSGEAPMHKVTLTKSFFMGKFEITQAQWLSIMGTNPSKNKGSNLPVEQINFEDVISFCNFLSDAEGLKRCYKDSVGLYFLDTSSNGYRLPSESEWEYACRAGTITDFYTGIMVNNQCSPVDSALNLAGWYCGNSKINNQNSTHDVGQKFPNSFGLYDMHGNVYEMIWGSKYDYTSSDKINPINLAMSKNDSYMTIRGGNYGTTYGQADFCRASKRMFTHALYGLNYLGFRIVKAY